MDGTDLQLIEATVSALVGRTAKYRRYDRTLDTPLNFVVNEAKKSVTHDFIIYWVEGALPELFTLSGFSPTPIVYNTRYIEQVYLLRRLSVHEYLARFRDELSERACLRVMAELAVRHKHTEWAIQAFLQSIIGQGIFTADIPGKSLLDLETEPVDASYVATWFFGLVHEIGHIYASEFQGLENSMFSQKSAIDALRVILEHLAFPDEVKRKTISDAQEGDPAYVLSPKRLATEALADTFAVSVLFYSTRDLMRQAGRDTFRVETFLAEMSIASLLIMMLDRCKQMALIADQEIEESRMDDLGDDLDLKPVSYQVRLLMTRRYVKILVAAHLFSTRYPTEDQLRKVDRLFEAIDETLTGNKRAMYEGLTRAMRFALFPKERRQNLIGQFATELAQFDNPIAPIEAIRFCDLAESFDSGNESVQDLRRVATMNIHAQQERQKAETQIAPEKEAAVSSVDVLRVALESLNEHLKEYRQVEKRQVVTGQRSDDAPRKLSWEWRVLFSIIGASLFVSSVILTTPDSLVGWLSGLAGILGLILFLAGLTGIRGDLTKH